MATAASANRPTEVVFEWEGKDRHGKTVKGETRAGLHPIRSSAASCS